MGIFKLSLLVLKRLYTIYLEIVSDKPTNCICSKESYYIMNFCFLGTDSGVSSNGDTNLNASVKACLDANSLLEKEESDVERAISRITEVQVHKILYPYLFLS